MNCLHDQKSLHETCLSGFEERLGAFILATNMTNSEAMVTSAAPYTTESKQKYPQGMSEARHGAVLFFFSTKNIDERIGAFADRELIVCSSHFAMVTPLCKNKQAML